MSNRREEILNGILTFPPQIMGILNPESIEERTLLLQEFWDNIWHNFLREKTSDTITWLQKFNDQKLFNMTLTHLSKAGWITTTVDSNYAYIQFNGNKLEKWVSKEELINIKFMFKFLKYRLSATRSHIFDMVQNNGKHQKTGLIRKGFMKAGNNKFQYDVKYLSKYIHQIAANVKKGLTNSTKDITYQEIITELLEYYSVENTQYTLGNCYIDSRGRAIFQCSKKVFNPVSCKDARALLICEAEHITDYGLQVVYAAIAELNGYRGFNFEDKWKEGRNMYLVRYMPDLNEMEWKQDYDDLHIRIWLERIYDNLDTLDETGWYVPIELDAMASLIQLMGVLTNDYDYMVKTNLIETEAGFQDIWTVDYVSRTHIKKAMTPQLYGSGKHARELWDANKLEYTQQQLNKMGQDLSIGLYANANNFKNFIINNVKPQTKMKVNINGEQFWIECNRFKWQETTLAEFYVYTSQQGLLKRVTRDIHLVPDTNQFKRYFVTLLLHNLDSQVCNLVCKQLDWVLPNHDSFTIHPNSATQCRDIYTNFMFNVWHNRKRILRTYFETIGIKEEYKERRLPETTERVSIISENMAIKNGVTKFSPYCLK